jgi:GNAT superfamily N-acetyltransferase
VSVIDELSAIEKLSTSHELDDFDCGSDALDRYLKRYARANQAAGGAQTCVVCRGSKNVVGYYSLAVGAVEPVKAPSRISKGLARHAIPVMLLARLAIDRAEQGRGLGRALLKDALLRTHQAAEIAGIRALLVHAKDEVARAWYGNLDFEPSPTDPYHLFLLMKDLRALLGE